LDIRYKCNTSFNLLQFSSLLQYHCHALFLIGLTGVHPMLLVSDSVSDTWQDQLLMVEKNVQISSNWAEVMIEFISCRMILHCKSFFFLHLSTMSTIWRSFIKGKLIIPQKHNIFTILKCQCEFIKNDSV
jgi:hypothetical protein